MRRGRTRSERDAVTVEIVYATVTGALLAAAGFVATISPVLAGAAHGPARKGCFTGAVIVAAALFCGRVALTLRRFERQNRLRALREPADPASAPPPGERVAEADGGSARGAGQRHRPGGGEQEEDPPPDQPSQPGRTNPDS